MEKKESWYKVEIRELIRKNLDKIHRKVGDSYGIDVSFLHKMISEYAEQELDKAREEGYQNCMDDIWEKARGLRSWTEHDGSVSAGDIEAGLREAYLEIEEELSKLNKKK